jgi:hypothetical protein
MLSYELERRLAAALPPLAARLGGPLTIMCKITAALLPTFSAGFRSALGIVREISATFMPAFPPGFGGELAIPRKTALLVGNTLSALASDFPLLRRIHRRESTVRCPGALFSHRDSPRSTTDPHLTVPVRRGSRKNPILLMTKAHERNDLENAIPSKQCYASPYLRAADLFTAAYRKRC